jgi:hypothetical protein
MKKKIALIIGGVLAVLLVIGAVGATVAYAQQGTPTAPTDGQGPRGPHGGRGLGPNELNAAAKALGMTSDELSAELKGGKTLEQVASEKGVDLQTVMQAIRVARPLMLRQAELDAAAKALGMTSDDLSTALKAGKTIDQLATDKGVDVQTVRDAIKAVRNDEMRAQIKQAVADGKMTQEKADWLLEGLDKGFLDGPGFGFGHPIGPPPADQQGK